MKRFGAFHVFVTAVCAVLVFGVLWSYLRGGNDFSVFFEAWKLVLGGRGREIYTATPDRFLYAPGFAWILAPLGFTERFFALACWNVFKVGIVFRMMYGFGRRLGGRLAGEAGNGLGTYAVAAAAVLMVARPLLVDFQYGQVNLIILGACVWALFTHCDRGASPIDIFLSWLALSVAAAAKLFPGILLLLPLVLSFKRKPLAEDKRKARLETSAVALGGIVMLLLPMTTVGFEGAVKLHQDWLVALQGRGMPMESHNQSFLAFLNHLFSGLPTRVIALYGTRDFSTGWTFSAGTIQLLGFSWLVAFLGLTVGWMIRGPRSHPLAWSAVLIGLLIVPSHLVWKPYFIFGIPAYVCLIAAAKSLRAKIAFGAAFLAVNFTGFDFIGYDWALRFEASALLLWVHLAVLFAASRLDRPRVLTSPG